MQGRCLPSRAGKACPMSRVLPSLATVAAGVTLMGGCAGLGRVPQQSSPQASSTQPPASVQSPSAGAKAAQPGASNQSALSKRATTHPPVKQQPATPQAAGPSFTASKRSDASSPETTLKPAAPVAQPMPSPLDIKSLDTRLRETNAISVVSKLALRNQMEALVERLRGFFQGRTQSSMAQLRQSYDLLVMKAIALLQDADPPLAGAIASSRESIWAVLSDPARLKSAITILKKPPMPSDGVASVRQRRPSNSTPLQHAKNDDDDGDHQQDVYQAAQGVGGHQAQQPQHDQDHCNGFEHGFPPWQPACRRRATGP